MLKCLESLKIVLSHSAGHRKTSAWVPVVAVALVDGDGRVLLQQRRHGKRHGGLWEFPGGKVEPGEAPEQALVREIGEELGIALGRFAPLAFSADPDWRSATRDPHLILLYLCREWRGEPQCLDGEAIAWIAVDRIPSVAMPPLDVPLVEALLASLRRDR